MNSSSGYFESDQLRGSTTFVGDDPTESYSFDIQPSIKSTTLHYQSSHQCSNNMFHFDDVKLEPDWEDVGRSSSPPNSGHTQHSEPISTGPAPTRSRLAKKRRDTESSTESTTTAAGPSNFDREKNRLAASKCRRKKKAEEHKLEERGRMLQVQNAILNDSVAALRDEVLILKNEILRHGTCDFPPIQAYIKTAASHIN